MMQPLQPLTVPCTGLRLIEASAGTGKTYTIATLYLRLLLERQLPVSQLLVVTYTVAATEELRDRLRAKLREALAVLQGAETSDDLLRELVASQPDVSLAIAHLSDALTCIDEAAVFTIHGFCQRMLQENAFESGTLFDAELLEDETDLITSIVEDFWRRTFHLAPPGLAQLAAARFTTPDALRQFIRDYLNKPELEIRPAVATEDLGEAAFTALHARLRAIWHDARDQVLTVLHHCKDLSRGPYKPDLVAQAAAVLDTYLAQPAPLYQVPPQLVLFTPAHLTAHITAAKKAKGIQPPEHAFFHACGDLAAMGEHRVLALIAEAIAFVHAERTKRKAARGLLAFDDLLIRLRDALEGPAGKALAQRIVGRYPVALIDEFQDTDPAQYGIFATIYSGGDDRALFMIGDPKQAIYSFRGADVFTYMAAKTQTAPEARYTLDTNWRSTAALVDGVNALFAGSPAPFIYRGRIDFQPVHASGKADREPLRIAGDDNAPLRLWHVPMDEDNRHGKTIANGWLRSWLPEYCAEEIVRLLNLGARGKALIGEDPLQPRHIAVLVRDRHEAAAIQDALRARRVTSVYYGRESVYASEEAEELERILLAIAEPTREVLLHAALCSLLWGEDANSLLRLQQDEEAWEALVVRLQAYHGLWLQHGFMAMFRAWLQDQAVPRRLLALDDGERRMTNLLQLAELLQQASREQHGIERLLRWFAEQRSAPNGDREEQQLRLESDADLVKIVTVHKSKGLEYPVVFLPFVWSARPLKDGPVLFHAPDTGRPILDLAGSANSYRLAETERLAEDLRLLYVALTRAKHLCYLAWGKFRGAERSALAWLLHGGADADVDRLASTITDLDDAVLGARLQAWAAAAPASVAVTAPPAITSAIFNPPRDEPTVHEARVMTRKLGWDWRVTSYTGLAAGHAEAPERPDHGSATEDQTVAPPPTTRFSLLHFPRGARAGTFMHRLLERIDFPAAAGASLSELVLKELARSGYGPEWQTAMEELVRNTLDTPLAEGLRLRDVTAKRRLIELEFHYPLRHVRATELERVALGLGSYQSDTPTLQFGSVNGVMRGFIDLVFEHDGRFYIADYKSNYLGARLEDYNAEALTAAVAHNRYDLQYLIYSVALHRYLAQRIRGYAYEIHFGGVFYLFLRGMNPVQPGSGVFTDRPSWQRIEALDALFEGRSP